MKRLIESSLLRLFILSVLVLSINSCSNPGDSNDRISELISQMTLEEKVSLLGGMDGMRTNAIPRLGIRTLNMLNGPNGVGGDPGTAFPTGVAMAATWNEDLMHRIGVAIGNESRAKKADILLGPTVNIQRMPLGGRNFESYSEDPFLSGRLGVNFVKGVQELGVATSLKHFILNNQELSRGSYSAEVDERALREIYLPAFEMVVKEAKPMTIMSAYNKFRGVHCTENEYILNDILREEWGFEGFIMSDWDAVHSTVEASHAGLDLEMPGKPKFFNEKLVTAVKEGKVSEEEIDEKVARILNIYEKIGVFSDEESLPKGKLNTVEHQELAAQTAREAIVLLKNENAILPLDKGNIKKIAVLGPNASVNRKGGGGSSEVKPFYSVSPIEGLKSKLGNEVELLFDEGTKPAIEDYIAIPSKYLISEDGEPGLKADFFNNEYVSGKAVVTRIDENIDFHWGQKSPDKKIQVDRFSARWTGKLIAPLTGKIRIGVKSNDGGYLYINNRLLVNNWGMHGPHQKSTELDVVKGEKYDIKVEYYEGGNNAEVKLGWQLTEPKTTISKQAVEYAKNADVVLLFVGLNKEFEGEGFDRSSMDMPGDQDELIRAVSAVNKNTIVIINGGNPVSMTKWIDGVDGIIQAWYLGQETGNALSDVLFGDYNPSGKLPVTFPKKYEDNPAFPYYQKVQNKAIMEEGIYVGYRYYDSKGVEPMFPFGYGLSYTSYEYSDLKIENLGDEEVKVSLSVKNTGKYDGSEIVQLYVHDMEASVDRPLKELKGFSKVQLNSGETKEVSIKLDKRAFAFYDIEAKEWVAEPGDFEIFIASSSKDIRLKGIFSLK
ncbi:MAG: glycoside hydrolase family 3 C-terminal domain-containing protein [Bacteroidota bacterium]